jgi:L-asparaginase II
MSGLAPQVFSKGGAEGVQCAALPELGLGIALKIDDGAKRGSERALAEVLAALLPGARRALADQLEGEVRNWRGTSVGRIVAAPALADALAAFTARPRGRARMLGGS